MAIATANISASRASSFPSSRSGLMNIVIASASFMEPASKAGSTRTLGGSLTMDEISSRAWAPHPNLTRQSTP